MAHVSLDPSPWKVTFLTAGWARYIIPVVIAEPLGPACLAAPLARSIVCPACGRERLAGRTGLCRAPVLFPDVDGFRESGQRGPRLGDVGGIRWGSAGSLGRCLCSTSWVVGLSRVARIRWMPAA